MQFILQKSEKPSQSVNKPEIKSSEIENQDKLADVRQAANLSEKQSENVGIVKPQKTADQPVKTILSIHQDGTTGKVEILKERKPSFGQFNPENSNLSSENLLDLYSQRLNNSGNSNYSNSSSPPVGVAGSLKPPAYRNPPAPKQMPNQKLVDLNNGNFSPIFPSNDVLMQNVQYRDLVQLIKYQREKINTQQNDLTKVRTVPLIDSSLTTDYIYSSMLKSYISKARDASKSSIWKPYHRSWVRRIKYTARGTSR